MEEKRVKSRVIDTISYDELKNSLVVKFHSGYAYEFEKVPESVYYALLASTSIGAFFNKHIKGNYRESKIS